LSIIVHRLPAAVSYPVCLVSFSTATTQSISRLRLNDPLSTNNEENFYLLSIKAPHNATKYASFFIL